MNIWNKVLLGLIIIVLIPLFYFSLVALKTHKTWRSVANKIEKKIEGTPSQPGLVEQIETIQFGDPDKDDECLQSVRIALHKYYVNRGRIWRHCLFQQLSDKGDEISLVVEKPDPHGVMPHMILFAFDEATIQEGGCFIGEFKVNAVDKNVVTLEPTMRLAPKALERIKLAADTKDKEFRWTLREVMPTDIRGVFATMKEEDLRAILPEAVVDEYLAELKGGKKRQLRDYHVLFKELDRQKTILMEEHEANTRHAQYMTAAAEDAHKQMLFRQKEKAGLMAELSKVTRESKAAQAHRESLERELAELKAKIEQLIKDNRKVATEIAEMQSKMIRQVDQRSATAAR